MVEKQPASRQADAQYCSMKRRWKSLSRKSFSAPEPRLASALSAGAGAAAAARAASVGSSMLNSLNHRLLWRGDDASAARKGAPTRRRESATNPKRDPRLAAHLGVFTSTSDHSLHTHKHLRRREGGVARRRVSGGRFQRVSKKRRLSAHAQSCTNAPSPRHAAPRRRMPRSSRQRTGRRPSRSCAW